MTQVKQLRMLAGALALDPEGANTADARAHRIAVVQHGDYVEAQRLVHAGEPEPYFGMAASVRAIEALLAGRPNLVVSLDAPDYAVGTPVQRRLGVSISDWAQRMPRSIQGARRARQVNAALDEFQPTHVLLRTSGLLGILVLRHCIRRRLSTLVVLATTFQRRSLADRLQTDWFIRLLNHSCVFMVANHRIPATQAMIEMGVRSDKACAYDWPGLRRPDDHAPKALEPGGPIRVLYAGSLLVSKGVVDLVEAIALLGDRGLNVELTVIGDGPDAARVRAAAARLPAGRITMPGQVSNDQVFARMRQATVVCVPSHYDYPEGLPFTVGEGLASRTPLVVSDHPAMTRPFREGEGMCFHRAGDAASLAQAIASVTSDPQHYADLSLRTAAAWARVQCDTAFDQIIERWASTF